MLWRRAVAIFIIASMLIPLSSATIVGSQIGSSFPMGISTFPLSGVYYTKEVEGAINVSSLQIGESYLPNGQPFEMGNASLQLNAMVDGLYWAQDVALICQQTSSTFNIRFVVNYWNLSGPFTLKVNNATVTSFQGLGVICYLSPSISATIPFNLSLFMLENRTGISFGYAYDNHSKIYYFIPISGSFQIGGTSKIGLPNDLELVWGGPGGGSVVSIHINALSEIFYKQGDKMVIPNETYSIGFDTGESVQGVNVNADLSHVFSPKAQEKTGADNPTVLWPIPPSISINQHNSSVNVTVYVNGKPIPDQEIEVETGFPLSPIAKALTNQDGIASFTNITSSFFVVYYPGNFTLSYSYAISSPALNSIYSSLTSYYHKLLSFLQSEEYSFKKGITSFFNDGRYVSPPSTTVNYLLLEYIVAIVVGVVISAVLVRLKT